MRRVVARGRMLPQSLSTDPRYGHLSLKAQVLYPLLWVNSDDQGRISGDPDEIKFAACPSVKEISAEEIPTLLKEMETQGMITIYSTSKSKAIQMLDWWEEQKLQWAYPSRYSPPEGWTDHLRYHPTPKEIITENWPPTGQQASESLPSKLGSVLPKELPSKQEVSPLTTPPTTSETEKEKEGGRGKRRLPSALGSKLATTSENELLQFLPSLKNWKFDKDDDLAWLREFWQDWPDFSLPLAKACRDYHSGRSPPKHKGHWKNRFREWMKHERQYQEERHGRNGAYRQDTQRDAYDWQETPEPDDTS